MSDFLQRRCPTCGRVAVKILKKYPSTRTCSEGHTWDPVKNPEPRPPLPDEEE